MIRVMIGPVFVAAEPDEPASPPSVHLTNIRGASITTSPRGDRAVVLETDLGPVRVVLGDGDKAEAAAQALAALPESSSNQEAA